jgi:LEA14-like dessication related protein
MRKLALALALAAVAAGCSHRKPKPPPPPAPIPVELPRIAFEAAKLEEFRFSGALLAFRCRVENPNPFPLSVHRVRFGVQLDGRPAAAGEIASDFVIPEGFAAAPAAPAVPGAPAAAPEIVPGSGSISFPVAIRFSGIPGFARVMAEKKEAPYALSGAVSFRTPHGIVEVPMATDGVLGIPRLPDLRVAKFAMRSASPKEVVLELRFRIGNPNGFPLPAAHLDYTLWVSKKDIARATGGLEAPIAPGEAAELVVPIRISTLKAGKAAARFLLPFASMKVELKGGFTFDGVPVPLDLEPEIVSEKERR